MMVMVVAVVYCAGRSRVRTCGYIPSRKTVIRRDQRTRYCIVLLHVRKNSAVSVRFLAVVRGSWAGYWH